MKEVETTAELDAPRELVEELLTPSDIIEYEGTYEVDGVGEAEDGRKEVHASAENIDTAFAFEELPNGYAFEQTGGEPFQEQYTTITVYGEDGSVEVVARSEFTFGGWTAVVLDWFAAGSRQSELQRMLLGLAKAIDEEVESDEEPPQDESLEDSSTTDESQATDRDDGDSAESVSADDESTQSDDSTFSDSPSRV
jgi:hypothetical protein